jgi:hypothetical protein
VLPQSQGISDQLRQARKQLEEGYSTIKSLDEDIRKAKFKLQMAELLDRNATNRLKDLEFRIAAYSK